MCPFTEVQQQGYLICGLRIGIVATLGGAGGEWAERGPKRGFWGADHVLFLDLGASYMDKLSI